MKSTGVVRRIDDLGRIVIPKEIRKTLRIKEGDPLEIFTDKNDEAFFKFLDACAFCQHIDVKHRLIVTCAFFDVAVMLVLHFDVINFFGIFDINIIAYATCFVIRRNVFLQRYKLNARNFDVQQTLDNAFADFLILHDFAEHVIVGKSQLFNRLHCEPPLNLATQCN